MPLPEQAGIRLRPVEEGDLRGFIDTYRRLRNDVGHKRFRTAAGLYRSFFKQAGKDSCHRTILIRGHRNGYCGWNDHGEVTIFLREEKRGRGYGTRAMQLLMKEYKAAGRSSLCAKTTHTDFWSKLGFEERTNDWRLTPQDRAAGRVAMVWDWRKHGTP